MLFPDNYPNDPPRFIFRTKMWHPNIFKNGEVCISILHPHEIDETSPITNLNGLIQIKKINGSLTIHNNDKFQILHMRMNIHHMRRM